MEEFVRNIGVGLRPVNDPFFEDSYRVCKVFQRKGITVEDDEELCHEYVREFPCYATGCKSMFHTLLDFEMHYNTRHRYVCTECKKCMPNPRLLEIHIQETHDSFFQVLSARQPMYQCYVSECDLKFNDPMERKNHCVTVHKFPKNFRFENAVPQKKDEIKDKMDIDEPSDKNESKNTKIQLNKNQKAKMFTVMNKNMTRSNTNVEATQPNSSSFNTGASALMFIPPQVKKSYTKALTNNQSSERNVLETQNMMDLAESLPD